VTDDSVTRNSVADNPGADDCLAEEKALFGLDDAELATHATVFAPNLCAGQVVLVSGGGSGIGRASAYLYARLGARVVICGRRPEALAETATGIRAACGAEVLTQAMTIRDPEQVEALIDRVWDECGGLDVLVNSAGGQFAQDSLDYSVNGWKAVIDTNLNGTWYMMQQATRRWRDAGRPGTITNIVVNIQRGTLQTTHTAAARAGVVYLSKSVAVEWAPLGIRINCIAPGAIASSGLRNYSRSCGKIPLRQPPAPRRRCVGHRRSLRLSQFRCGRFHHRRSAGGGRRLSDAGRDLGAGRTGILCPGPRSGGLCRRSLPRVALPPVETPQAFGARHQPAAGRLHIRPGWPPQWRGTYQTPTDKTLSPSVRRLHLRSSYS